MGASPRGHGLSRARDGKGAPGGALSLRVVLGLLVLALPFAALCSLGIQALRDPDGGLPGESPGSRPLGPRIAEALVNPRASVFECSEEEINAHLAKVLPERFVGGQGVGLARVGIRLEGERGEWVSEHRAWGRSVVLRIRARVWVAGGRVQIQREGGSLGRLELGLWAVSRLEPWLERFWPLLKKEWALLHRLDGLRAEKGRVILQVRAGTPVSEGV